jgi:hypothetical protein
MGSSTVYILLAYNVTQLLPEEGHYDKHHDAEYKPKMQRTRVSLWHFFAFMQYPTESDPSSRPHGVVSFS